jgi:glycosyltransferase involved in cell wall biosynthesis
MKRRQYDVCAAVVSHLPFDARVWKEARTLAGAGYRVALIGARYDVTHVQRRTEHGVDVVEIPFGMREARGMRRQRARTLVQLWWEVLRTPARVYHAHNIHTGPVAWMSARLRRASLVYDAHELYGEVWDVPPLQQGRLVALASLIAERFMVHRSEAVVTTNRSRVTALRERHGPANIEVLGNVPARVDEIVPLDPGFPSGRTVLLYQGGVYARSRAFAETLRALALLDDAVLVVIGFGRAEDLELVRKWARDEGVADRVEILPPRPFGELVQTAAAATVGLVPIRADNMNHYFGDTNKLFEYMMAGLPVVASDLPEIRLVVTAGDPPVGELFEPSRPESIAAAVRRVVDNPDQYAARRREARALALRRFNWELESERLLSLYSGLFANSPDGAR